MVGTCGFETRKREPMCTSKKWHCSKRPLKFKTFTCFFFKKKKTADYVQATDEYFRRIHRGAPPTTKQIKPYQFNLACQTKKQIKARIWQTHLAKEAPEEPRMVCDEGASFRMPACPWGRVLIHRSRVRTTTDITYTCILPSQKHRK